MIFNHSSVDHIKKQSTNYSESLAYKNLGHCLVIEINEDRSLYCSLYCLASVTLPTHNYLECTQTR